MNKEGLKENKDLITGFNKLVKTDTIKKLLKSPMMLAKVYKYQKKICPKCKDRAVQSVKTGQKMVYCTKCDNMLNKAFE